MSLLDDVLAANAAVAAGGDVPVPAVPANRRVVIVACSEIVARIGGGVAASMGFARDEAFVVGNAGARVQSADGDVARSVVAALAAAGGGEVFVAAHENCEFLAASPESVASLLASPGSSMLQRIESLLGESFVSARKLAITSAETLRSSPFLPRGTPVHALVFSDGRGRLTCEQSGYDLVGSTGIAGTATPSMMSAAPSPILAPGGSFGFGASGPVSLMAGAASSLMGVAPPPLVAPSPDMGAGGASFMTPPPPPMVPGFSAPLPPFPPPPAPVAPAPPSESAPPPLEPLRFKDPTPAAASAKPKSPADSDDPFRRAAETLERLRRQRRR